MWTAKGLDIDGNRRGSAANLTTVLFLDKNLFYSVLGPRANREARGTHARRSFLDLWPTYLQYVRGRYYSTVPW